MSKKRPPQGYKLKPAAAPEPAAETEPTALPGPAGPKQPAPAKASSKHSGPSQPQAGSKRTQPPAAADPAVTGPASGLSDDHSVEPATADLVVEETAEVFEIPQWNHSLSDVEPEPVSERELTGMIRDWRRGRATKTIGQVLSDGYVAVFAAVMIIAMLGGAVWKVQADASQCTSDTCVVGRSLLPWVAMGAAFALTALAAKIFGPVVASAAEGFWLMDAPIRRGRLLVRRFIGVVVAAGLIAAVIGGLLAALTGYEWAQIWQWMLAMGIGAAGLIAVAASEQTFGRSWLVTTLQWIFGFIAVGTLAIIVSVAANWMGLTQASLPDSHSVAWVAVAGGVLLILCGALGLSRLGMIHRARLVSGGSLVSGMQGAAFAMDFGLMRDILVERAAMVLGHVRPKRGKGTAGQALVWREFQRLGRYPRRMLLVVVSIVVPYATGALGFDSFSPFISALILLIGFVPLLGSMRIMTRTKGLARTLPLSNPQIRKAMATVPAVVALVWAVAATPAFYGISGEHYASLPQAFITSALTAAAGLLAAIRWVTAKPPNYAVPMMQTGFGAMPPTMIFNIVRGIDVVVLVTGPMLLGWAWWISAIIALIVGIALSGFYSMEEMQAQQAELQKEKERMGGGGGLFGAPKQPVAKQKIAPPRGYSSPRTLK